MKSDKKSNKRTDKVVTSELTPQGIEEIKLVRLAKIEKMKAAGINPFAYTYPVTYSTAKLQHLFESLANGSEDATVVSVAGRILARRVFGKLAFFELMDDTGTIQLYLERNRLDTEFDNIASVLITDWRFDIFPLHRLMNDEVDFSRAKELALR